MMHLSLRTVLSCTLIALSIVGSSRFVAGQAPVQAAGTIFEESLPSGQNYDKADFKFWMPSVAGAYQGVLVLVPGSNGDGRSMADDAVWQAFATKHKLAIAACRFTDKPHDQSFIEHYINASLGTGQAPLDALASVSTKSRHPEIATAPLLLWGMSAGGEFNYEFTAWKPERVMAFVVNKGGIYYTALAPRGARVRCPACSSSAARISSSARTRSSGSLP